MIFSIIDIAIAVLSILILVAIHEFGHFIVARKFGVRVEEFGIGLPPRVIGKKVGDTIYSLNALPLGAFVRMTGEEQRSQDPASFSVKPVWQRMAIVAAGVIAFWIVAVAIFSVLGFTSGIPMGVDDTDTGVLNPQVQIIGIASKSPAESAKLSAGDIIEKFSTVSAVQTFINSNKGREITLQIQRGATHLNIALIPRANPPEGEGPVGLALARSALVKYPWYRAPVEGTKITLQLTSRISVSLWNLVAGIAHGHGVSKEVQLSGPVGIIVMLKNMLLMGPASFFSFVATLSVYLAVFNILPIPAADGGRLMFLALEFLRKKPLAEKIEQKMILISFGVLIVFFVYVTFKDVMRLL